ncbi:hypothetical protein [Streptococcus pseudopneumoniae]|nr:hypothetical protein [Streptococcus pseudopneumoniae]
MKEYLVCIYRRWYLCLLPGLDYPEHGFCPVGVFAIIDTQEADGYT